MQESKEFNNEIINSPSKEGAFGVQIPQSSVEMKTSDSDDQILKRYDGGFEQPQLTLGSKKRMSCLYSQQIDECSEPCKKMRFVEETAKHCRVLETLPSHLLEKVDVGVSAQTIRGAKLIHTSLNYEKSGFHETEMDEENSGPDVGYNFIERLEPEDDAKSTFSSVGSCSSSNGPYRALHYHITSQNQGTASHYDDTASSYESSEPSYSTKDGGSEENHCLELNAYRSTLVALYASGPLSWEQETLLTNLRLMLHISNEEHFLELKQLRSARNRYS